MAYEQFAKLYDRLMEDAPYDMWLSFFEQAVARFMDEKPRSVLDIGCGTGEIAIRLAQNGYEVSGIDLSEEMLVVAQNKAANRSLDLSFFQQDMRELHGFSQMDAAVIFCDSLNYLRTPEDVETTFKQVSAALKDGGLLLFDVHTLYKMEEIFGDQTFSLNGEDISYIWECHPGEVGGSVHHDLTFFVQMETGYYQRLDESHYQRTYARDTYEDLLHDSGFEIMMVTADFSDQEPSETTERLFFIAKKK